MRRERDGRFVRHPLIRTYAAERLAEGRSAPEMVVFVGHSGPSSWTFDGLLSAGDIAGLPAVEPSVVVQWGCWNTYHVLPGYDTLAHRMTLGTSGGAAAVIGNATLTRKSSNERFARALLPRLLEPGTTIGQAIVEAKWAVGDRADDVVHGLSLLGDPALVVAP